MNTYLHVFMLVYSLWINWRDRLSFFNFIFYFLPSSLVAAQSTLVLIMQNSPSLGEIQPESRTVSIHLSSAPMPELQ